MKKTIVGLIGLVVGFSFSSCVSTISNSNGNWYLHREYDGHAHNYLYDSQKTKKLNDSTKDTLVCSKCGASKVVSHEVKEEHKYREESGRDEAICIHCHRWVGWEHQHVKKDICDHTCKTCGKSITEYKHYLTYLEHYKVCLLCSASTGEDEGCSGYSNSNKTGWTCSKCGRTHTCEFELNGPLWSCKQCTNSVWR